MAQEVCQDYAKLSYKATQETVESALWNVFIAGYVEVNEWLRAALYQSIETLITSTAEPEATDKAFNRNIDCWMQSTSIKNTYVSHALSSSWFTRHKTKRFKLRIQKAIDNWRWMLKAEGTQGIEITIRLSQSSQWFLSSHKLNPKKHLQIRQKAQVQQSSYQYVKIQF